MSSKPNNFHKFLEQINQFPQKRESPYIFQIGFDFGTSYSKCIYRDLVKNKSFIFTFNNKKKLEFLLSSSIIYKNNIFSINDQNQQYPEHGLWHIKMAIADLAKKKYTSPTLSYFNKIANLKPGSLEQEEFIKACGLFYLSRALNFVLRSIRNQFQDFGENLNDEMYVTMGIPVSDIEDKTTEGVFLELLEKAWTIACNHESLPKYSTYQDMKTILSETICCSKVCHVYPEVSANIQAFKESSNFPGSSRRIYLVSDVGAGTVDQCCFTCYQPIGRQDTDNYFSAQVFNLGSRIIEYNCTRELGKTEEEWRQRKEKGEITPKMESILHSIANKLEREVRNSTLNQLQERLYHFGEYITPKKSILSNTYLIFSGGGDMKLPYHKGVIDALTCEVGCPSPSGWKDRIITLGVPQDIKFPKGCQEKNWMKRLYVAYGLSFKYENLSAIKLPSETKIQPDPQSESR